MGKTTFQPGALLYVCTGAFIGIFATALIPPAGLPNFYPAPLTSQVLTSIFEEITFSAPDPAVWPDEAIDAVQTAMGLGPQTVSVRQGDTLSDVLMNAGIDRATAFNAVAAVQQVYNLKRLQVGQELDLTYDALLANGDATPLATLNFEDVPGHSISVARESDGAFAAKEIKAITHHAFASGEGIITSTLFEAAQAQQIPTDVLTEMVKLFSYDVDFQRDIQKGDKFAVMYDRVLTDDDRAVRNLDIRYASMTVSGTTMKFYAYRQDDGTYEYYNAKGEGIRKALLRTPVNGAILTSNFGMRRHPILGYSILHKGVDFGVPTGTPIMAAGDGVVEMRGPFGSYGNYIRIRHTSDFATAYAHMSRFADDITIGKRVHQGQVIGYVGATGRVTGPHLHFEVMKGKAQINPLSVKFPSSQKLEGAAMAKFQQIRTQTDQDYAAQQKQKNIADAGDTESGTHN